jgi:transposase
VWVYELCIKLLELTDHYKILLELDENWVVSSIHFDHSKEEVIVALSYQGSGNSEAVIHDYRPSRRWRHLDTLQYATYIEAKVPRMKYKDGKVRTASVPWASSVQRHSYLLEKKL